MTGSTAVVSAYDGVVGKIRSASARRSLRAVSCICSLNSVEARSITTELLSIGPKFFWQDVMINLPFDLVIACAKNSAVAAPQVVSWKWIPRSWRDILYMHTTLRHILQSVLVPKQMKRLAIIGSRILNESKKITKPIAFQALMKGQFCCQVIECQVCQPVK